jgi:hypothetical protein
MIALDPSTITGWVISGLIALLFGLVNAWVTHKYQKARDDRTWTREMEELEHQLEHGIEMLQLSFQQKTGELAVQNSLTGPPRTDTKNWRRSKSVWQGLRKRHRSLVGKSRPLQHILTRGFLQHFQAFFWL